MTRFKALQIFLAFMMLILSVVIAGCGSNGQTGHWLPPDTAPTVTVAVPADLAINVALNSTVTATFSKAMDPATIVSATPGALLTFTLKETVSGTNVPGTVTMDVSNTIATFTPTANLKAGDQYTATITTAATDSAGHALVSGAVPNPWTFTTIGAIIPGATCTIGSGPTIPTVTSSNPTDGNLLVTTSTTGVANSGKLITATFSLPMDPATINSATAPLTFTLKETTSGTAVLGTVTMDASHTVATFTTTAALSPGISYTASITTAATSLAPPATTPTAISCSYVWTFTTVSPVGAGQASIDLGTASTYAIFVVANAGLTLTGPDTLINGDIGFMSNGAGSCTVYPFNTNITCAGNDPPVNGVVHNGDAAAAQAQIDFLAAYTDGAGRVTGRCELANGDLSSAQAACVGVSPSTPGPTYGPGLYHFATALGWSSTITLDAGNNPDAVFIFQADTALTTASDSTVVLAGQAQAKNVFWIVGTAATLGVSSTFEGTIIVGGAGAAAITVDGGTALLPTLVQGRLFSGAAATVGTYATVTVPAP
jgi:hypothetical protein